MPGRTIVVETPSCWARTTSFSASTLHAHKVQKIRASQLRVILCDDSAVAVTKQVIHDEGTEIHDAFGFVSLAASRIFCVPCTFEVRCTSQPPSIAAPT